MTDRPVSAEQKMLKGVLAAIERRAQVGASLYNEFGQDSRIVDFKASRTVLPPTYGGSDGIKTLLEIRLGSTYTSFRGDNDLVIEQAEQNAMRALCRCLYQDVLDELMPIMQAVGDGKRGDALRLLDALFVRLNGRE